MEANTIIGNLIILVVALGGAYVVGKSLWKKYGTSFKKWFDKTMGN